MKIKINENDFSLDSMKVCKQSCDSGSTQTIWFEKNTHVRTNWRIEVGHIGDKCWIDDFWSFGADRGHSSAGSSKPTAASMNAGVSEPTAASAYLGVSEPTAASMNAGSSKPTAASMNAGVSEPTAASANVGVSEPSDASAYLHPNNPRVFKLKHHQSINKLFKH